jgi:hypothetical protein
VLGVAVEGGDEGHELAAGSICVGGRHRDLATQLARLVRLAFADAFRRGGVQRVDLRSDLTVDTESHRLHIAFEREGTRTHLIR